MIEAQVVVLAKQPVAGRSKTRLSPPLSPAEAAEVARAALLDTLDVVAALPVRSRVVVLDGSPEALVRKEFWVLPQRGDGLGERLTAAFEDSFARRPLPTLLVGMDTPQITPVLLADCLRVLLTSPAVLGLAADGGWWALGQHAPDARLFDGIPMSAADTGSRQHDRLVCCGTPPVLLPTLRDIDVVDDLLAVAAQLPPTSRVARAVDLVPVAS